MWAIGVERRVNLLWPVHAVHRQGGKGATHQGPVIVAEEKLETWPGNRSTGPYESGSQIQMAQLTQHVPSVIIAPAHTQDMPSSAPGWGRGGGPEVDQGGLTRNSKWVAVIFSSYPKSSSGFLSGSSPPYSLIVSSSESASWASVSDFTSGSDHSLLECT